MKILYVEMYQIDNEFETVTRLSKDYINENFVEYVKNLVSEMPTSVGKRKFEFESETSEVYGSILRFLNDKEDNLGSICANRLAREERKAQDKITHLGKEIQQGIFFIAHLEYENGRRKIVLSKNDHNNFLDQLNFELRSGLPTKNKVFKSFIGEVKDGKLEDVFVFDTNSVVSRYWWQHFLELRELYTDEYNTTTAFKALESRVFRKIKNSHPSDHTILRNSTVKAFRTLKDFDYGKYLNDVWKDYLPVDPYFPLPKYIKVLENLPENKNFDTKFKIARHRVTARSISNKIELTDKIDLLLKEEIDDLHNQVKAIKDPDGKKYLKIRTNTGYESFKIREQAEENEANS